MWTDDMTTVARDLFAKGKTMEYVAQALGVTMGVLKYQIYNKGLKRQPKPVKTFAPDTRTLTGRMMGDPPPGRSALDTYKPPKKSTSSMGWW